MSLLEENNAILMHLKVKGKSLGCARVIDFSHLFSSLKSANSFAEAAKAQGFDVAIDQSQLSQDVWDVTASKTLLPSADAITEAEAKLGSLAALHEGRADGWGFFEN